MTTRIVHNGHTIEMQRDNVDQVRALVDTVNGAFHDLPTCDIDRAARITGVHRGSLQHYLGRLDVALERIGAYLITEEMLECERLAADSRSDKIKVKAYWGYGAEFPCEMTLAQALRKHAAYRNTHQRQSGIATTRSTLRPDDDDGIERDSIRLVDVARVLLSAA